MNCPMVSIFPKVQLGAPTDIFVVICSCSGVDIEVGYFVYVRDKFEDCFSGDRFVVMKVDPRSIWIYVPHTPVVEFGKSDSFSLVVGDKPLKKGYWEGFDFFGSGLEFSGIFVKDLLPLGHKQCWGKRFLLTLGKADGETIFVPIVKNRVCSDQFGNLWSTV